MPGDNILPKLEGTPPASTPQDRLIDVRELARILNVPASWLYERTRREEIPCVRLGKYIRFDLQEVLAHFRAKSSDGNLLKDAVS